MATTRIVLAVATVAAIALLAGCLQIDNQIVLHADGGGEATATMAISPTAARIMAEMEDLDPDGTGESMAAFSDIDRDEMEQQAERYGVEITRFETTTDDGRETLHIGYRFPDLRALSAMMMSTFGGDDEDGDNGLGVFDAGDGNLVLRKARYDFPDMEDDEDEDIDMEDEDDDLAGDDLDPDTMQREMELMGQLMATVSELDVRMAITVPGDIVSTNAPSQDGRTSIWTVNQQNMMTAEQDLDPEIVFSGDGLSIEPQQH